MSRQSVIALSSIVLLFLLPVGEASAGRLFGGRAPQAAGRNAGSPRVDRTQRPHGAPAVSKGALRVFKIRLGVMLVGLLGLAAVLHSPAGSVPNKIGGKVAAAAVGATVLFSLYSAAGFGRGRQPVQAR